MNYEIRLSDDDALTIISLLENSGSASLAVKVRDQMYAQRDAFLDNLSKQARLEPGKPLLVGVGRKLSDNPRKRIQ